MVNVPDRAAARFRPSQRLRTPADFQRVYRARVTAADGVAVVYSLPNDGPHTRLGLSVSCKVGNAVVRNRWKRVFREAFRLHVGDLPPRLDLIVVAKRRKPPSSAEAVASLVRLSADVARRLERRRRPAADEGA